MTEEEFQSYPGCDGRVTSIVVDEEESLQSPESNTGDVTCRWKLTAKQDSVSVIHYYYTSIHFRVGSRGGVCGRGSGADPKGRPNAGRGIKEQCQHGGELNFKH